MRTFILFALLASLVVFVMWKIRGIASDNPDEDDNQKAKEARQLINEKAATLEAAERIYRENPVLRQFKRKDTS